MTSARTTYPLAQTIFMIQTYYRYGGIPTDVQTKFKTKYGHKITLSKRVMGSVFLTKSINSQVYRDKTLEIFFFEHLENVELLAIRYWFMEKRARPHRAPEILTRISEIIGLDAKKHTVSVINWSPYNANLNVCDCFL